MRHLRLVLVLTLAFSAVACARPVPRLDVAYVPSARIHAAPAPIAGSAIEYRAEDLAVIQRAGAVFVGQLELKSPRGATSSGVLRDRASLVAASHGATHLMFLGDHAASAEAPTVARFALVRVEHDRWPELPASLRPRSPEPIEPIASLE